MDEPEGDPCPGEQILNSPKTYLHISPYPEQHVRSYADTPSALGFASVRLTIPICFVGLALEGSSQSGTWWAPFVLATPVLRLSALSHRRSLMR